MAFGDQGVGFNNQLVPLFEAGDTVIINSGGMFIYNGTPAAGNLITSVAPSNGVDDNGNAYLQGVTSYLPSSGQAVSMEGPAILWFTGPIGGAGPWTVFTDMQYSVSDGALLLNGVEWFISGLATTGLVALVGSTPETWHSVSLPAGWTGTARVKLLAQTNMAVFDAVVVPNAASGGFGSFPSAAYYPTAGREYPVGYTGGTTSTTNPRLVIPTSGAITMGGLIAGTTVCVTQDYPLD